MSISYTEVVKSEMLEKASFYGVKEFVRVKVDPEVGKQYPFPRDYKLPSCFLPKKYLTWHDRIHNFNVRSDDIFVTSFLKSGTTWTMNIVIQLMNKIDFSNEFFDSRQWSMESTIQADFNDDNSSDDDFKKLVDNFHKLFDAKDSQPSPRLIKSHLPAQLLPKDIWTVKPKLIYVYRDVKDAAISLYHMCHGILNWNYAGTMQDLFDTFLNDQIIYGPYFDHVNGYRKLAELDHILLLKYEDMLADPFAAVKKICYFLDYSYSDDQLNRLTKHVSIENMRSKNIIDKNYFAEGYKYVIEKHQPV